MTDAIATAGNAKKAAITQAANPLVQDGQKLIPSVTRVFSSKSDMYVYLQAYEPDAATTAQPLLVYVTFFQGPNKVMETPPVEVTDGLESEVAHVAFEAQLPAGQAEAGRIRLRSDGARSGRPEGGVLAGAGHGDPVR